MQISAADRRALQFAQLPQFTAGRSAGSCTDDAIESESHRHCCSHNVYFLKSIPGLDAEHPALKESVTAHEVLCADTLTGSVIDLVYRWPPLHSFLADVTRKAALYPLADPLAALNVMRYREGQALGWHFDRAEFTVTLLLRAPTSGGMFEYCVNLRRPDSPNYDGVGQFLDGSGKDECRRLDLTAGALNVFLGQNTLHHVTPIEGERDRRIAILSYSESPGVTFSSEEQMQFYGRALAA